MNKCPKCGRKVVPIEDKLFRCDHCNMLTDCEDDGTVGYGSQQRYAERKEEYENRCREREAARRNRQSGRGRRW